MRTLLHTLALCAVSLFVVSAVQAQTSGPVRDHRDRDTDDDTGPVRDHRDDSDDSDDSDDADDDSDSSTSGPVRDHRDRDTDDDDTGPVRDHRDDHHTGDTDDTGPIRDHRDGRDTGVTGPDTAPGESDDGPTLADIRLDLHDVQGTLASVNRLVNAAADLGQAPAALRQIYGDVRSDWLLFARTFGLGRLYRTHRSWSLYGAVMAESSRYLGVGAGGEVAWDALLCRFAGAGLDAQLFRDPDAKGVTYAGFATACLPMIASGLEFTYRFERQVRPSLAMRPVLLPSRYSGDHFGLRINGLKWRSDTTEFLFGFLDMDLSYVRQDDAMDTQRSFSATVDTYALGVSRLGRGFLGDDTSYLLFSLRFGVRRGDRDIAPELFSDKLFIAPVRVRGVSLGGSGLYLDAAVGWTLGRLYREISPTETETIADRSTVGVDLSVRGGTRMRRFGVHAERAAEPTFNRVFLIDDRLTGWLLWQGDQRSTLVEGFLASTVAYDETGASSGRVPTGGVSVEQAFGLGERLSVSLRGDAARSYYTDPESTALEPQWAFRLMAVMSSQLSSDD